MTPPDSRHPQDPWLAPGSGGERPPVPSSRAGRVVRIVLAVAGVALLLVGVAPIVLLGLVLVLNGGQLWSNK